MSGSFCPFVNGSCRTDCMFRTNPTGLEYGVVTCSLPIYLSILKDNQVKKADDIIKAVKEETAEKIV